MKYSRVDHAISVFLQQRFDDQRLKLIETLPHLGKLVCQLRAPMLTDVHIGIRRVHQQRFDCLFQKRDALL